MAGLLYFCAGAYPYVGQRDVPAGGSVRPLDITMVQAMAIVKHIGVGSAEALRGADLRLPAGAGA